MLPSNVETSVRYLSSENSSQNNGFEVQDGTNALLLSARAQSSLLSVHHPPVLKNKQAKQEKLQNILWGIL